MTDRANKAFCAVCFMLGSFTPWALLVASGLMSVFATGDYWSETAAWLAALGVALLALSYLYARLTNDLTRR